MRIPALVFASVIAAGCLLTTLAPRTAAGDVAPPDELGFRKLRESFHLANSRGDYDLMLSLWAPDAVLHTAGGAVFVGPEDITNFISSSPHFGKDLVLTSESKSRIVMHGNTAEYGFECITIDVGGGEPLYTSLSDPQGSQNPAVTIVRHTHTTGIAARDSAGRWVFVEFNGAAGPLPPAADAGALSSQARSTRSR